MLAIQTPIAAVRLLSVFGVSILKFMQILEPRDVDALYSGRNRLHAGAIAFLVCGLVGAIFVAVGLSRTDFHWDELWPNGTLANFLTVAWLYLCCTAVVGLVPALRMRIRGIAVGALLLLLACGAGLGGLAATILLLVSSLALGDLVTRDSADMRPEETWAVGLVAVVIGLGLWSVVIWVLAHFPVNYPPVHLLLLVAPLFLNSRGVRRYWGALQIWLFDADQARVSASDFLLGVMAFGFFLIQMTVSMWPEVGHDGLALHLRTATVLNQRHAVSFDVHEQAAVMMPYFSDWLFAVAYQLGGEPAAKLTNGSFLALTLLGTWGLVRQHAGLMWATLAVAIVASTPLLLALSATMFAENYLMLATIVLLVALDRTQPSSGPRRWRQDAGIAILLAIPPLVKPYGLFITLAGLAAWSFQTGRVCRGRQLLGRMLFVGSLALVIGFLPYGYAWVATGNPLFPFYNAVFRSPLYPAVNISDYLWMGHLTPDILYRMTFDSLQFGDGRPGTLGMHYLILLPCMLAAPLVVRNRTVAIGGLFVLLYGGGLLILIQYLRYLAPVLPVIVTVALIGAARALDPRPWLRRATLALLVALCGVSLLLLPTGYWILYGLPLQAAFGETAQHELIKAKSPMRLALPLINQTYGVSSRVAFLGPPLATDLHGTPLYAAWYNDSFKSDSDKVQTPEQAASLVSKWRLTHAVWQRGISPPLRTAICAVATSRQVVNDVTIVTFGTPPPAADSTGPLAATIPATVSGRANKSGDSPSNVAPAGGASIEANPNPIPFGRGPGTTTIRWNSGDQSWGQVFVSLDGGADSTMITEGGGNGDIVVNWIYPGHDYEFRLYAGKDHSVLLAKVTVTVKAPELMR